MKFVPLVILSFIFQSAVCQNTVKYNNRELATLSKVWGLMKYYHPAVSQGKLNWDSVLLSNLKSQQKQTVAVIVQNWTTLADKTAYDQISQPKADYDSILYKNFNISWIKTSAFLSATQKLRLSDLAYHPKNVGSYYSNADSVSWYTHNHEQVYKEQTVSYRLLNLFRIWNVIEYYYPYKHLLDHTWSGVLNTYVPKFLAASDSLAYKRSITLLAAEINDTHGDIDKTYNYDLFGAYSAPFKFRVVEGKVVITKPVDTAAMQAANLALGDVISEINGQTIPAIIGKYHQYIAVSNPSVTNREAYNYLFSSRDSSVIIKGVKQNGKAFTTKLKTIKRVFTNEWDRDGTPDNLQLHYKGKNYKLTYWDYAKNSVVYSHVIDNIGYIDFSLLTYPRLDTLMKEMKDTKGIVFDLRGYKDEWRLLKTFYYLYPKPTQFGIRAQPIFGMPGKFAYIDNIIDKAYKYIGKDNPDYYKGKVVVLINEGTQSAEEMWSMMFKYVPNVIFVGSQTAGADGNRTRIKMTDGREIVFSGIGIYYANGKQTQRIGIVPDIIVKPTIKSLQDKDDVLADKAFSIVDQFKK